ncbi:MAG: hypothetical protein Salg2KO_16700 [Salibacteraceae bacterium]
MRNQNKINQLGRTSAHRKAMMSNMASSLIEHKRISTTVAKAKALRGYVEPLITKSKTDSTHSRRMVFRKLQNKEAVSELFREVAPKVAERPGGYTRIIRTGFRQGDAAEMCIIELVDFNTLYVSDKKAAAGKKTRRSRRGSGGGSSKAQSTSKKEETSAASEAAEVVEDVAAEVKESVEEVVADAAEVKESAEEAVAEAAESAEEVVEEAKEAAAEVVEEVKDAATDAVEEATEEKDSEDDDKKKDGENA